MAYERISVPAEPPCPLLRVNAKERRAPGRIGMLLALPQIGTHECIYNLLAVLLSNAGRAPPLGWAYAVMRICSTQARVLLVL